ncbi:hypothetical protein NQ314_002820 [Rhamnusium bicolor]|uniref:Endonuclease/exonuclease/phosphatase domain-containing protein n=1 Tax=Rhamnusium bicolor TaxID=1586634 RepID=A0AAV8ZQ68_9CUCU|nr:hypothetical protein NQ314_002820 [Rhamnusium bicolor]
MPIKLGQIVQAHPNDYVLVVGDYNASKIEWVFHPLENCYVASEISDDYGENIVDSYNLLELHQFNGIFNNNGKLLDVVFSSIKNINVLICDTPLVPEDIPHHKALEILLDIPDKSEFKYKPPYSTHKFHSTNYDLMNEQINNVDWVGLLNNLNTVQCVSIFYIQISNIIIENVPLKGTIKNQYPVWYSANTKSLIKEKYELHKRWKKIPK